MIVRAGVADQTHLLTLIREFYEIDHHPYRESRVLHGLVPLLRDDRYGQVWLIADEGRPPAESDGYAIVTWGWSLESGGLDCILDELYLRRRGEGRGAAAIEQIVAAAAAAGASAMFLETEARNERVRHFYHRHGFETEDSIWLSRQLETDSADVG
jgi:GNAT superfamily N-acetyltransferase